MLPIINDKVCSAADSVLIQFNFYRCKKHNAVELKSLLQYLVNQLKKGMGIELVVLEVSWLLFLSFLSAFKSYESDA